MVKLEHDVEYSIMTEINGREVGIKGSLSKILVNEKEIPLSLMLKEAEGIFWMMVERSENSKDTRDKV